MKIIKTIATWKKYSAKSAYGYVDPPTKFPIIAWTENECLADVGAIVYFHEIPEKTKCIKSYLEGFKNGQKH